MHGQDPLIVASGKYIRSENIFGIVVTDFRQALIFAFLRLFGIDSLRDLNIKLFIAACGNKINLTIGGFADVYGHLKADVLKWKNTTYRELLLYVEKERRTIFKLFPVEAADQTSRKALIAYLKKCFSMYGDSVLKAILICDLFGNAELDHIREHLTVMRAPEVSAYTAERGSEAFDAAIAHAETELAEIRAVEARLLMLRSILSACQAGGRAVGWRAVAGRCC